MMTADRPPHPDARALDREIARLRAIERAVVARMAEHNRTVRAAGGNYCRDEFCTTFRPLVRK